MVRFEAFQKWGETLAAEDPSTAWSLASTISDPLGAAGVRSAALNAWALTDFRSAANALLDSSNPEVLPATVEMMVRQQSLAEAIRQKFDIQELQPRRQARLYGEIHSAGAGADSEVAGQWQCACGAQGCDGW
jgi:hypothetical protein